MFRIMIKIGIIVRIGITVKDGITFRVGISIKLIGLWDIRLGFRLVLR